MLGRSREVVFLMARAKFKLSNFTSAMTCGRKSPGLRVLTKASDFSGGTASADRAIRSQVQMQGLVASRHRSFAGIRRCVRVFGHRAG